MKVKELTEAQGEKICNYIIAKYCPIAEDGMRHNIGKACYYCPLGVSDGKGDDTCAAGILEKDLDQELEEVIKND